MSLISLKFFVIVTLT